MTIAIFVLIALTIFVIIVRNKVFFLPLAGLYLITIVVGIIRNYFIAGEIHSVNETSIKIKKMAGKVIVEIPYNQIMDCTVSSMASYGSIEVRIRKTENKIVKRTFIIDPMNQFVEEKIDKLSRHCKVYRTKYPFFWQKRDWYRKS